MEVPVVLFVYKRPDQTRAVLEGLKNNHIRDLIIFSDGSKNSLDVEKVKRVREMVKEIDWCNVQYNFSNENKGLAQSIIEGVTEVFKKYEQAVVLEDDCVPSSGFMDFMTTCLDKYRDNSEVMSITGYTYPIDIPSDYPYSVYFFYRSGSWGWATWKDRWNKVDWEVKDFKNFYQDEKKKKTFNLGGDDLSGMLESQMSGRIDSWAIRWAYAHYKNQAMCLSPVNSFIENIGFGPGATHTTNIFDYKKHNLQIKVNSKNVFNLPDRVIINKKIVGSLNSQFKVTFIKKIKGFLKYILYKLYGRI